MPLLDKVSEKEYIKLKLDIIHNHTAREEEIYLADIRVNVFLKWKATSEFITQLQRSNNHGLVY